VEYLGEFMAKSSQKKLFKVPGTLRMFVNEKGQISEFFAYFPALSLKLRGVSTGFVVFAQIAILSSNGLLSVPNTCTLLSLFVSSQSLLTSPPTLPPQPCLFNNKHWNRPLNAEQL
jgi:hypothetical protein